MPDDSLYAAAIDIGTSAVKVVQFGRREGSFVLARLGVEPLPPGAVQGGLVRNAEEVMRALEKLLPVGKKQKVVLALPGRAAMLKTVLVPAEEDALIEDALEAEAMQVLPIPLGEVRLSHLRVGAVETGGTTMEEYSMIAVREEALAKFLDFLEYMNYDPVMMEVGFRALASAFALSRMARKGETVALVDVGASETLVSVVRDAHTLIARAIPFGGERVTAALADRLKIPHADAEAVKIEKIPGPDPHAARDALSLEADRLAAELRRTFDVMWRPTADTRVETVLLSGGGALLTGLSGRLSVALGVPVKMLEAFRHVVLPPEHSGADSIAPLAPLATLGAGLAYRAVQTA